MEALLALLGKATTLITEGAALVPEVEALYGTVKGSLSSNDDAYVRSQLDALHIATTNTTAAIETFRAPAAATRAPGK